MGAGVRGGVVAEFAAGVFCCVRALIFQQPRESCDIQRGRGAPVDALTFG